MATSELARLTLAVLLMTLVSPATAVTMQTKRACEGEVLRIDCGHDNYIKIWSALYGRANPTICGEGKAHPLSAPCRADKSNFESMRHCDDKNSCEITAESTVFGDPCNGTEKYLQVDYFCRSRKPSECNPRDYPTYKTKYACDNTNTTLSCPNQGDVIKILDANYGRQGSNIYCKYRPNIDDIYCDDDSGESFERVCLYCRGKNKCTIPVNSEKFKDHCLHTNKYLSVHYVCVSTQTSSEEEEEDEEDEEEEEEEQQAHDADVRQTTTLMPRGARPQPAPKPVAPVKPGQVISGSIGSVQKDTNVNSFTFGKAKPGKGSVSVGGNIGTQNRPGSENIFTFGGSGQSAAAGGKLHQGRIMRTNPDGSQNTFTWGGPVVTRFTDLFAPVGAAPGSTKMLMKIIVTYDTSGQKFFTLQPFSTSSTSVQLQPGSTEYFMKIDTGKISEYTEKFTLKGLIEEYNNGITFNGGFEKFNVPFQFTSGKGLTSFFTSLFQMITEVDSTTGRTVTAPSSSSSNFQVILDGGNQDIVDYLMTFVSMDRQLRYDLLDHNLFLPLRFYNDQTQKIEDIKIPFYVNYNGFDASLLSIFRNLQEPATQFGMRFQITGQDGSKQLITFPFTRINYNGKKMLYLTLPTCSAYQMYGFNDDKEYLIDPDGINNGVQPFVVNCEMEEGETIVNHNRKITTVASYPEGQDQMDINIEYEGASADQLRALREVSEDCEQELSHKCNQISWHFQDGVARIWWESLNGMRRENWGGVPTNESKCHCGMDGGCQMIGKLCNCDNSLGRDYGALTDKDTLPVAKVVFQKPAAQGGQDKLQVGPLMCKGDKSSSTLQYFIMLMQMMAKPMKTCSAYKKQGYELDGVYLIDPDGSSGEVPFTVFCEMEKPESAVTVIHHELSNQRTTVNNFEEPGSYSMDINYRATMRQIDHLKHVSGSCEQSIVYECRGSAFHINGAPYHWWVSFDNDTMHNWGGAPSGFEGCGCKTNSTCVDDLKCNCDKDDNVQRQDSGILDDKDKLPVMQLRFGDTGGQYEFGYYTLGPLRCWGSSGRSVTLNGGEIPKLCHKIKEANSKARSGNYHIQPSETVEKFLVYCDMKEYKDASRAVMNVIHPRSGGKKLIDGFYEEPGTWYYPIQYRVSKTQLRSLTTFSGSCKQFVSHGCHGSVHYYSETGVAYTMWESLGGENMTEYWGNAAKGCECYNSKSCLGGADDKCNCDANTQEFTSDEGYLQDKSKLPVLAIRSGDVSDNNGLEYGTAQVGPLMCEGEDDAQSASSRAVNSESKCVPVVTSNGALKTLPGEQDFSKFEFSVRTSAKVVLKLSPLESKVSSSYQIEINGAVVTLKFCLYRPNGCYVAGSDSPQSLPSPLSASKYRQFAISVNKTGPITLSQGGENLTFTDSRTSKIHGLSYFAFQTNGGSGRWYFDSNCPPSSASFHEQNVCAKGVGKLICHQHGVSITRAAVRNIKTSTCEGHDDASDDDDCPDEKDITGYMETAKRCKQVEDGHLCYIHTFYGKYPSSVRKSACIKRTAHVNLEFACRPQSASSRTSNGGPCESSPCQNGGECTSNDGASYSCKCPSHFGGAHCEFVLVTCSALGDPHYEDFAMRTFDFQGDCSYVLARHCEEEPDFEVQVVNEAPLFNAAVSSTHEVFVTFNDIDIELKQGEEILVDGDRKSLPFNNDSSFSIEEDKYGWTVLVVPEYNLKVMWDRDDIVKVILPKNDGRNICGLCGSTQTSSSSPYYMKRSRDLTRNITEFGNSWKVDDTCIANTDPVSATQSRQLSRTLISVVDEELVVTFCQAISSTNAPFDQCPITAANADNKREACQHDYGAGVVGDACGIIRQYRQDCEDENPENAIFPENWLEINTQCGSLCPAYLSYTECRAPCFTCALLRSGSEDLCSQPCVPGCECPDDQFKEGDSCVAEEECGCYYQGEYHQLGASFLDSSCETECKCLADNNMQCDDPANQLCPMYHTAPLSSCIQNDGIYECTCNNGYEPNEDGTDCIAVSIDDVVYPEERRRRRRSSGGDECGVRIGMGSVGRIPDAQITASSSKDMYSLAKQARPNLNGWTAQRSNRYQWIKVDIGIPTEITGVLTQGRNPQAHGKAAWLRAFAVDVSMDGQDWTRERNADGYTQFYGNSNAASEVTNWFAEVIRGRFLRITPISWHNEISLRFEILGCKPQCDAEIGSLFENGHVSSDNWFVVNVGEPISCKGHVTAWKVIRAREEPLEAWILRPQKTDPMSFKLVGSNHIPAGAADKKIEYEVADDQRIPVQSGDVVGFLYERSTLYSIEDGEETTDFMWVNLRDISQYETMGPGSTMRFTGGQGRRAYSAVAVLQPSNGPPVPAVGSSNELGLKDSLKLIPDEAFSASSHVKGHRPVRARLDCLFNHRGLRSGWTPKSSDRRPFLQVDLGSHWQLSGLVTQGRHTKPRSGGGRRRKLGRKRRRGGRRSVNKHKHGAWVTSYFVQFSQDCEHWKFVKTPQGRRQRFMGNLDPNTPKINYLDEPIHARCIRIRPKTYRKKIGLRLELLGSSSSPCSSYPCEEGGTCHQSSGLNSRGYVCKCKPGRTGSRCQFEEGSCRSAGDSHYQTFDGRHYYFPGECTYTLAKDCGGGETPTFDILTNNAAAGREIYIFTNDMFFEFRQEGIVRVDGEACKLPIKRSGVSVVHNAVTGVLLQTTYGLSVQWDGHHRVRVNVPTSYHGKVCGLCGNFNGDNEDDVPQDLSAMQNFAVEPENCGECDKCNEDSPCIQNSAKLAEAVVMCEPIIAKQGPFAACNSSVDPADIYDDCLQDVCDSDSLSRVPRCTQLAEYADVCAENGVAINSWRSNKLCGITCPPGMIYNPCGSACPATCGDPHAPNTCTRPCVETCECPEGLLKEGNKLCVEPLQCGCTDNGCYYELGTTFYRFGCKERGTCRLNGEVDYWPTQCGEDATCGSNNGVYGCFCNEGFSGDGIDCARVQDDTALLVCENDAVDIYCGLGQHIDIVAAAYGRNEDFEKCPSTKLPSGECSAESAMIDVVAKCQGKESCNVKVTSEVFGDPCFGVSKYLEVDFQCTSDTRPKSVSDEVMKRVCQGDAMEIDCGDLYIEITDAVFGRLTDGEVCPGGDTETTDCRASSSLAVVERLCQWQHSCVGLQASSHVFGENPCRGTFKYLQVRYRCSMSISSRSSRATTILHQGLSVPADPCANHPCQHGGQCLTVETPQRYKCSCPHDWTGPNCEFEEVSCRASGVSHIMDFNKQHFEFLGDSKYDFVASRLDHELNFRVMIKKARSPTQNEVSLIEAVHVHYDDKVVELKQEHKVLLDGKKVSDTMTLNFGKINLCRVGNYLLLKTDFEMIVAWDGLHRVQVRMPSNVARKTHGLCGTYQGLTGESPGFVDREGNTVDDVNEFGSSWRVPAAAPSFVHSNLISVDACAMWPDRANAAADLCSELMNSQGVFRSCFAKVEPDRYYQKCVYDMCATLPSQELLCQAMAEYADVCLDEGVVLDNWRNSFRGGQCEMACPDGQVYSACVQSCPKSCGNPHAKKEPMDRCYEGCKCQNDDTFQDGDQCLERADCGCTCTQSGVYFQPEDRVVNDQCTGQYICLPGGEWDIIPLFCDVNAHCGVVENRQGCICNVNYVGTGTQCTPAPNISVLRKSVSQGNELHIDCGDQYVDILSAEYSFTDPSSAGAATDPDCKAGNEMDVLANHITKGGSVLRVTACAYEYGETCRQVGNVLTVEYICSSQPVAREVEPGKVVRIRGCQQRLIHLKCKTGSRINILTAMYGRQTGSEVCGSTGHILTTSCRAPEKELLRRLEERCQDREQCNLHLIEHELGKDPCVGTSKYLDVTYMCKPFEPQ